MNNRRTRVELTEANRRTVLDAAYEQFLARGYHGASLESIAAAAGFSKGVVYSQFGSKDDLILVLLEERIAQRHRRSQRLSASLSGLEGLRAMARDAIGASADSAPWQALLLEFRARAARDADLNKRYASLHRHTIAGVAGILTGICERGGVPLPLPSETLAVLFIAIASGLSAEFLVDPRLDVRAIAEHVALALVAFTPEQRPARRRRTA